MEKERADEESKIFKTKDLIYASILHAKAFELLSVKWEGDVAYWVFSDEQEKAEALVTKFINSDLNVNLKVFVESFRTLRQTLHRR